MDVKIDFLGFGVVWLNKIMKNNKLDINIFDEYKGKTGGAQKRSFMKGKLIQIWELVNPFWLKKPIYLSGKF